MTVATANLQETFVVHTPEQRAATVDVTPTIYQQLDEDFDGFKGCELIACHRFASDWGSWEVHPAGDEVVVLMSGAVTFVLNLESGEQTVDLAQPGDFVVVPRGIWHTARVSEAAQVLFVTPGEGTRHQADES